MCLFIIALLISIYGYVYLQLQFQTLSEYAKTEVRASIPCRATAASHVQPFANSNN